MKKVTKKHIISYAVLLAGCLFLASTNVFAADGSEYVPGMYATFWALVPSIVAIMLALITKEVYSSLFIGITIGGLFYSNFNFEKTVLRVFQEGILGSLTSSYNMGILVFLVILGIMVVMMNKAGGSAAFGRWAAVHIKSRVGAQLVSILLGALIFIDDYFNCLTVGSVMRPITDKHKISREKLAYLIDATAAPVCIIAPISSWAAAVTGFVEGEDGFAIFMSAIPYNYYAILTIVMMVAMVVLKLNYGSMATYEKKVLSGEISYQEEQGDAEEEKGHVMDMIFPIASLILCCVIGMIYTGGFFDGVGIVEAFSGSDAPLGLMLGSFFAYVFTIIYYLIRKTMTINEAMECVPEGFKSMVPAILILTFAWSLKTMTDSLGADVFVASVVDGMAAGLVNFLPAIIFVIAALLAFATGTSWGTFGILIPIVVNVFSQTDHNMMIISISACMAGAVCGDHCSPISDTTIMASAGAQCNHVNHVSTQLPYVITCAAVSAVCYIIAGFVQQPVIVLAIGAVLMVGVLVIIKKMQGQKVSA